MAEATSLHGCQCLDKILKKLTSLVKKFLLNNTSMWIKGWPYC
jgi:hypothetical protein